MAEAKMQDKMRQLSRQFNSNRQLEKCSSEYFYCGIFTQFYSDGDFSHLELTPSPYFLERKKRRKKEKLTQNHNIDEHKPSQAA